MIVYYSNTESLKALNSRFYRDFCKVFHNKIRKEHIMKDDIQTTKSSPWVIYVTKLKKFFERDDDISIEYDPINESDCVYIKVKNPNKYYALSLLLDTEVEFGNFHLQIFIMPAKYETIDNVKLFKMLFENSCIVESIDTIRPDGSSNSFNYILFNNEVVKYWTDNLGNPHGNSFTLYETLADDIFINHDGVMFTTAEENRLKRVVGFGKSLSKTYPIEITEPYINSSIKDNQ